MDCVWFTRRTSARSMRQARPIFELYKWSSLRNTNSSRVGEAMFCCSHLDCQSPRSGAIGLCQIYRFLRRFHRMLTGASTLTRMKDGRLNRFSNMFSSHTSVITQRCCHCFVTKSNRDCTQAKEFSLASCCSTSSSGDGCRARCSLTNPTFSVRYSATEFFPAQIPIACYEPLRQGNTCKVMTCLHINQQAL